MGEQLEMFPIIRTEQVLWPKETPTDDMQTRVFVDWAVRPAPELPGEAFTAALGLDP